MKPARENPVRIGAPVQREVADVAGALMALPPADKLEAASELARSAKSGMRKIAVRLAEAAAAELQAQLIGNGVIK